ncbi:MAG: iron ABC transporter permease [Intestinibacter bartlettii]|uniref:FecCD family ABC transporter permease n=1 Tax=Intestinibacter bartlettii TaxID=261299 RepID=UPI0026EC62CE|nr:iron ABC transporter permease [Intestinibacter bartlettii]MDO5009987.1 iron ABC transporter permease [Intestinibacter bartlettii]
MNKKSVKESTPMYIGVVLTLLVILVGSIMVSVTLGSAKISVSEVYKVLGYKLLGIKAYSEYASGPIHDVVWVIRFPRVVLAIAIGMGLTISGVVMQAIVKNPLADPYILGISSGASLGATFAIMLGFGAVLGGNFVGVMAFIGALLVSFGVLLLANIKGSATSSKLILAGMALSAVCSSFSNFIIYIANDKTGMQSVTYWILGSLAGAKWETNMIILPVVIIACLFFWSRYRVLNLMLLGDDVSITLGTDLHKPRHIYLIITSIMIGLSVYCAGVIGFVGLIIPHAVRMIFGTDHKKLIPISALVGSIFMIFADALSRIIIPNSEMPIGILISMVGAPVFIYLMVKKSYGFGGVE